MNKGKHGIFASGKNGGWYEQESAKPFWNGPDNKYFNLCGPCCVCYNHLYVCYNPSGTKASLTIANEWVWLYSIKILFTDIEIWISWNFSFSLRYSSFDFFSSLKHKKPLAFRPHRSRQWTRLGWQVVNCQLPFEIPNKLVPEDKVSIF